MKWPISLFLILYPLASLGLAADWTYSVSAENGPERRAYLWIPPECKQVRALMFGIQNMLEQPMFEDPTLRKALADSGVGIVWIAPGSLGNTERLRHNWGAEAGDELERTLKRLAQESGYPEVEFAPLIVVAHSAATPVVWGAAGWKPERMVAIIPYKGWFAASVPPGVPALHVSSEYAEVGGKDWGETYRKDELDIVRLRSAGADRLIGDFTDIGAGHFEWNTQVAPVLGMFVRKAVDARVAPGDIALHGPVKLRKIDPASGVLVDPTALYDPATKSTPASEWKGDPAKALWYFDDELFEAAHTSMTTALAKKPQMINVLDGDKPASLENTGVPNVHIKLEADGVTFKLATAYLDKSPTARVYNGSELGHSPLPIELSVTVGALKQIGPDRFCIWMGRGQVSKQGAPFKPVVMAVSPGDETYRRADRPAVPLIDVMNKKGEPQTIEFPVPANVATGVKEMKLSATASSKLPVQFFVVSGPAEVDDDGSTLHFLPIPPATRLPARVIVGAFQWGRTTGGVFASAKPVFREFYIGHESTVGREPWDAVPVSRPALGALGPAKPAADMPGALDVTAAVAAQVQDNVLEFRPSFDLAGSDPAPMRLKKVRVDFSIAGVRGTKSVFEGTMFHLAAPAGKRIKVERAYYGDFPATVDVTVKVSEIVNAGQRSIRVTPETLGGDPIPMKAKTLIIHFLQDGKEATARGGDDGAVILPDGPINLISAEYGD